VTGNTLHRWNWPGEPIVATWRPSRPSGGWRPAGADLAGAAVLLLGGCQQVVFVEQLAGADVAPLRDRHGAVAALVRALLAELAPAQPSHRKDTHLEAHP
jgi:hypothetical protein